MAKANKKILIIEDDYMISSLYQTKFEAAGFNALAAYNGVDGPKLAKNEKIDLILLDVILPQLDGFSVLEALKKDSKIKDIPVVMSTNLATEEDIAKGKKLGAVDYIIKTEVMPSEIVNIIKKYLK